MSIDTDAGAVEAPTADRSNWRVSPNSRWAFHHVSELIPTAPIANAPGDVWTLPSAPRAMDGFALKAADGSPMSFDAMLAATETDAIVILRDGAIVHERYFNGNGPHRPHILMSASKAVVGLMAGLLQRDGAINLDALVSDYVPEVAATAYRGATLRNLIDMRTGVVLDEAAASAYDAASNWDPPLEQPASFSRFFATLKAPDASHGGPFRYISPNTDLFGLAVQRATGRSFADLTSELLWKPLGAEDAAGITTDDEGAPRTTGGVCATARDLARIGQLIVQGGRRGETQIVPPSWIEDIATGGDHEAWARGEWGAVFGFVGSKLRYRSGWYIVDDDPRWMFAMGIHGQNLFVDRANRIVIAKLSSQAIRFDYRAVQITHAASEEIRRVLLG